MLDKIQIVKPAEIEKRSMEIITSELNGRTWPEPEFSIVKRCIHTSADFDYADNLCFSENAANIGVEALKNGAHIVTDTRMAWSGINKKKLASFGGEAHCFMSDEDVAETAKKMQPSGNLLQEWEDNYIDSLTAAGYAEDMINASLRYATFTAKQVLAYAKADGYNKISKVFKAIQIMIIE